MSKHNTADVFNRQLNYTSEVEENNCLLTLQSKLKAMRTITPESFKPLRGKPNEMNHARHMSGVSALMKCKSIIRDESEMDWYKLPESSMREPNEADHTECVNGITTLVRCKLAIQNVMHHSEKGCASSSNVGPLTPLPRRVIIAATAMKKTHKKPVSALMNLI